MFAFGLYRLARRLGDERAGWFAAGAFTVLSFTIQGPLEMLALHTEWFMEAFSLMGFLLYAATHRTPGFKVGVTTGVLFGLAALNKQPGLLDFGVLLVITGLRLIVTPHARRALGRLLAGSVLGVVLPLLAAWGYFASRGVGAEFLWYSWTYNTTIYMPEVTLGQKLQSLGQPIRLMSVQATIILALAIGGLFGLLRQAWKTWKLREDEEAQFPVFAWLVLGWGAAGWLSSGLSGRTFPHYAVHIVPATCLAAGWMAARLWSPAWRMLQTSPIKSTTIYRTLLFGTLAVAAILHTGRTFRAIDSTPDEMEARLRTFAQTYSQPTDRWFVWGFFPEIYAYAQRIPGTRFVYCNFLTGLVPWTNIDPAIDTRYAIVPGAWDQLLDDLEQHPPSVVIETTARHYGKYPLLEQTRLREWLPRHYAEVATPSLRDTGNRAYLRIMPSPADQAVALPPFSEGGSSPRVRLADGNRQDPLIRIEGDAAAEVEAVSLVVGEQTVRTLLLPQAGPSKVAFMITAAELRRYGTDEISLLFRQQGEHVRTRRVFVTRRLELDRTAFMPEPRLRWGNEEILPLDPGASWHVSALDRVVGWSPLTEEALRLEFPLRFGMQRITFTWHGDQPPTLDLTAPDGTITPVPVQQQGDTAFAASLPAEAKGSVTFRAAPGTSLWIGDLAAAATGPALYLGDEAVRPIYSEIGVQGLPTTQDGVRWFMHGPARAHYRLQPGVTGVVVRYGFIDDAYSRPADPPTTGAEFRIEHLSATGAREVLFKRYLDPVYVEPDRGLQEVELTLTRRDFGELHLVFSEGRFDQRSGDWTFLQDGRLLGPGPDIILPDGNVLTPRNGIFGLGEIINVRTPEGAWDAHAPSRLLYDFPPELSSLTVRFGFKPGAYESRSPPHITDGVELVIERLSADGQTDELHRAVCNPATHPEHRGMQETTIELPQPRVGDRLVIRTTNGPARDIELDWTIWGPFSGTLRNTTAALP